MLLVSVIVRTTFARNVFGNTIWFKLTTRIFSGGPNRHSLNEYRKIYWTLKRRNPKFSCRNTDDADYMVRLDNSDDWLAEVFEDQN